MIRIIDALYDQLQSHLTSKAIRIQIKPRATSKALYKCIILIVATLTVI
jgi:hypothetical protein